MQLVNLYMPGTLVTRVGEALCDALPRSGYALCKGNLEAPVLYELPLPAAHLRSGPILLRSAVLTGRQRRHPRHPRSSEPSRYRNCARPARTG